MSAASNDKNNDAVSTDGRSSTVAERTAARTVSDDSEGLVITDFEEAPYPALVAGAKVAGKGAAFGAGTYAGYEGVTAASDAVLGITPRGSPAGEFTTKRTSIEDLIEVHETSQ